jgi:hypothetical protein
MPTESNATKERKRGSPLRLLLLVFLFVGGAACVALIIASHFVSMISFTPRKPPYPVVDLRFDADIASGTLRMGKTSVAPPNTPYRNNVTAVAGIFKFVDFADDQCGIQSPPMAPYEGWFMQIHLWLPALLLLAAPVYVIVRKTVRYLFFAAPGICYWCGYNLRENVSGVCPECGNPIESQSA